MKLRYGNIARILLGLIGLGLVFFDYKVIGVILVCVFIIWSMIKRWREDVKDSDTRIMSFIWREEGSNVSCDIQNNKINESNLFSFLAFLFLFTKNSLDILKETRKRMTGKSHPSLGHIDSIISEYTSFKESLQYYIKRQTENVDKKPEGDIDDD